LEGRKSATSMLRCRPCRGHGREPRTVRAEPAGSAGQSGRASRTGASTGLPGRGLAQGRAHRLRRRRGDGDRGRIHPEPTGIVVDGGRGAAGATAARAGCSPRGRVATSVSSGARRSAGAPGGTGSESPGSGCWGDGTSGAIVSAVVGKISAARGGVRAVGGDARVAVDSRCAWTGSRIAHAVTVGRDAGRGAGGVGRRPSRHQAFRSDGGGAPRDRHVGGRTVLGTGRRVP